MFIVTVHYWDDVGDGESPILEKVELKFHNESAARRQVEEEIQRENTELVECPALKIREYGTYAAMRKK